MQSIKPTQPSLKDKVNAVKQQEALATRHYYANANSEEVNLAFKQAKQLVVKAIIQQDYDCFLEAATCFQALAFVPVARLYFMESILRRAHIPITDTLIDELLLSPELFVQSVRLSRYHFERYLLNADYDFAVDTKAYVQANDEVVMSKAISVL